MHMIAPFSLFLFLLASNAWAGVFSGKVIKVSDGDTVLVVDDKGAKHTVRLAGIDAPEKDQLCGREARRSLVGLVLNRVVTVDSHKSDKYGREVGKLVLNGADVNLSQIARGHGWHYKKYEFEQSAEDRHAYADAEDRARASSSGLWGCGPAVPPWEWRHRTEDASVHGASSSTSTKSCFSDDPAFCNGGTQKPVIHAADYYERVDAETKYQQPSGGGERLPDGGYVTHIGPRGGEFHYSVNGKKVYHKK